MNDPAAEAPGDSDAFATRVCVPFPEGAERAVFAERPNRFVVRAKIGGRWQRAHLADPGRLKELLLPGAELLVSPASGRRKTRFTVQLVRSGDRWVSINSRLPNVLVGQGLEKRRLGVLPEFGSFRRESPFADGRIDFLLETPAGPFWLEVKGCSLVEEGIGLFPDAPTERGRRQIRSLIEAVRSGGAAGVLFVVGRDDATEIRANARTDPGFAELLRQARDAGLLLAAYRCRVSIEAICLDRVIPVVTP